MNLRHFIAGKSFVYRLKSAEDKTEPCGRPFFCDRQELTLSHGSSGPLASISFTAWTTRAERHLESLARRPVCHTVSYATVRSRKTAPVFNFAWKPFSMYAVRVAHKKCYIYISIGFTLLTLCHAWPGTLRCLMHANIMLPKLMLLSSVQGIIPITLVAQIERSVWCVCVETKQ